MSTELVRRNEVAVERIMAACRVKSKKSNCILIEFHGEEFFLETAELKKHERQLLNLLSGLGPALYNDGGGNFSDMFYTETGQQVFSKTDVVCHLLVLGKAAGLVSYSFHHNPPDLSHRPKLIAHINLSKVMA